MPHADAIEVMTTVSSMAFGELHPYKTPELLALPVDSGLPKCLQGVNSETALSLS